jgi:hypothetical protein
MLLSFLVISREWTFKNLPTPGSFLTCSQMVHTCNTSTLEAEAGVRVWGQPGVHIEHKAILSYIKNPLSKNQGLGFSSVVEHMFSMHKALGLILSMARTGSVWFSGLWMAVCHVIYTHLILIFQLRWMPTSFGTFFICFIFSVFSICPSKIYTLNCLFIFLKNMYNVWKIWTTAYMPALRDISLSLSKYCVYFRYTDML